MTFVILLGSVRGGLISVCTTPRGFSFYFCTRLQTECVNLLFQVYVSCQTAAIALWVGFP